MDETAKSITKYCEIVRDNIYRGMEASPGFVALLQQCENAITLLKEKEKEIEKLTDWRIKDLEYEFGDY